MGEYQRMRRSVRDANGTSFWLKAAVEALDKRDPIDAASDAQDLLDICNVRLLELHNGNDLKG